MINLSTIKKFNELNDEIINKAIEVEKMCDELKHHEFEWYNNNAVTNFALSVDLTDALDSFNYGDYKEAWYIIDKVVDYVTEVYCHAEINEHTEISVAVKDILVLIDKIEDIFNK